jgi:hypothetical protein
MKPRENAKNAERIWRVLANRSGAGAFGTPLCPGISRHLKAVSRFACHRTPKSLARFVVFCGDRIRVHLTLSSVLIVVNQTANVAVAE